MTDSSASFSAAGARCSRGWYASRGGRFREPAVDPAASGARPVAEVAEERVRHLFLGECLAQVGHHLRGVS
jgi:hypothetical protein